MNPICDAFNTVRRTGLRSAARMGYGPKRAKRNQIVHGANILGDLIAIDKARETVKDVSNTRKGSPTCTASNMLTMGLNQAIIDIKVKHNMMGSTLRGDFRRLPSGAPVVLFTWNSHSHESIHTLLT